MMKQVNEEKNYVNKTIQVEEKTWLKFKASVKRQGFNLYAFLNKLFLEEIKKEKDIND